MNANKFTWQFFKNRRDVFLAANVKIGTTSKSRIGFASFQRQNLTVSVEHRENTK
jgi:hypothetical protein